MEGIWYIFGCGFWGMMGVLACLFFWLLIVVILVALGDGIKAGFKKKE
jgi:hypothetical protein